MHEEADPTTPEARPPHDAEGEALTCHHPWWQPLVMLAGFVLAGIVLSPIIIFRKLRGLLCRSSK